MTDHLPDAHLEKHNAAFFRDMSCFQLRGL